MPAFRPLCCLAGVAVVAGCSGTMQGVIRGEGTPVKIQYEQGMDRDFYRTTIDAQNFSGQAVNAGASSGVGTVFAAGSVGSVFTSTSSGNFIAVLIGDQGASMRCQMNYADSSGLTSLGGVGICQHSDGRVIDVTW